MPTFDDDELEQYYRRIEDRTRGDGAVPVRRAAEIPATPCPTPDKTAHVDEDEAWLALAVLRAMRLRQPELDVYRCRCGFWHITSRRGQN